MAHAVATSESGHGAVTEEGFLYGLIAEFDRAEDVLRAARRARDAGYDRMDAYSPFPVEGLSDALGHRDMSVPWIMLAAGALGCIGGFGFLWWSTAVDYRMNVAGRPAFGWPSFIPITFEMTVLLASLAGVFGMFMVNGLPEPYHPVFDAPNFDKASSSKFFLCIEADDPRFDIAGTRRFLESLNPVQVSEVERRK